MVDLNFENGLAFLLPPAEPVGDSWLAGAVSDGDVEGASTEALDSFGAALPTAALRALAAAPTDAEAFFGVVLLTPPGLLTHRKKTL